MQAGEKLRAPRIRHPNIRHGCFILQLEITCDAAPGIWEY